MHLYFSLCKHFGLNLDLSGNSQLIKRLFNRALLVCWLLWALGSVIYFSPLLEDVKSQHLEWALASGYVSIRGIWSMENLVFSVLLSSRQGLNCNQIAV